MKRFILKNIEFNTSTKIKKQNKKKQAYEYLNDLLKFNQ